MKKGLLIIVLCGLLGSTPVIAQERVKLHPLSTSGLGHNIKRCPVRTPEVWFDDSMLLFPYGMSKAKIEIYKDGMLIYYIELMDEVETLEIPNNIEGLVELHLEQNSIAYIGNFEIIK